jgi:chemotaxis protein CheZ
MQSATATVEDPHGEPTDLVDILLNEVRALSKVIAKARGEIAEIRPNDLKLEKLPRAGKELEAIVKQTEAATGTIMDAAEAIMSANPAQELIEHCTRIIEACAFQDLTGQRITKVVSTLTTVENRLQALETAWGGVSDSHAAEARDREDDAQYLNGPALEGEGHDQAAIDALFDDAPAKN